MIRMNKEAVTVRNSNKQETDSQVKKSIQTYVFDNHSAN